MPNQKPKTEEWEKEFGKELPMIHGRRLPKMVKDFLRQKIQEARIQESQKAFNYWNKKVQTATQAYKAGYEKAEKEERQRCGDYKSALEDMVHQFAYQGYDKKGFPAYHTGGLSALERAFSVLGWKEPKTFLSNKCEYGKCKKWATCGINGKSVCGKHFNKIESDDRSNGRYYY